MWNQESLVVKLFLYNIISFFKSHENSVKKISNILPYMFYYIFCNQLTYKMCILPLSSPSSGDQYSDACQIYIFARLSIFVITSLLFYKLVLLNNLLSYQIKLFNFINSLVNDIYFVASITRCRRQKNIKKKKSTIVVVDGTYL